MIMPSVRTLAAELPQAAPGSEVRVEGWVHRRRVLATVAFVVVRDRSGLAQVVVRDRRALPGCGEETVISVAGVATRNPDAPGGVEVTEPRITLLSEPALPPAVDLWRPTVDAGLATILDHAAVSWRHPARRARWQLAAASLRGFRAALDSQGFTEIQTPKLVSTATESGADVFRVDYFGRPAYLAQSPQFYKQALVGMFERVFEVGPAFRAEPHDTARHLAQYTSLDAEFGFIGDHHDVMAVLRDAIAGMLAAVRARAGDAVHLLGLDLPDIPARIPEIDFTEAQDLIARQTQRDPRGEPDLAPEDERWLCAWALATHGSEFLYVTGYPMAKRPFYTHPDPARPAFSNGFDLLFRGLELVTGGQRLHRHADYVAALAQRGADPAPYASYLDVFAHGMPPHGGFAIGLERWTARLTGATNIRQAALFPRDLHRLSP
jgi:nondiscriminating aspartyl-tRNA synthetase